MGCRPGVEWSLRSPPGNSSRPRIVLIVDDHADTREIYSMYFAAQGMRVLGASDGVTAIRMAVASRPDVVVTDQYLPLIDGSEATGRRSDFGAR